MSWRQDQVQHAGGNVKEPFSWIVQQLERGFEVVLVEPRVPVDVAEVVIVGEAGAARMMRQNLILNQSSTFWC